LLDIANLARSSYYYHLDKLDISDKYSVVKEQIILIFNEHRGRYGYRRITAELKNRGFVINHKTVKKMMGILGLKCLVRVKKYRSYRGAVGRIAPNILARDFVATSPNQKWSTDVTEFSLLGKKLYLSPIIDLFNGEIISYNLSEHSSLHQTNDMLDKAFYKITDTTNLILHSDQGWQYQHKQYRHRLEQKGVIQSMSRKGNCLDNAVIENFFGILKSELFYRHKFESIEHFRKELDDYIYYYNNKRIKMKLNGLSPVEYRMQNVG
jgi:transposase InsO family protein